MSDATTATRGRSNAVSQPRPPAAAPTATKEQDAYLRKLGIDVDTLREGAKQEQEEAELFAQFPKEFDTFGAASDPTNTSLTPEQRKALDKAMGQMLARADALKAEMEASGEPADLDAIRAEAFGHIPENFVPARFIKELQDWRAVRDAMNDRAAHKMAKTKSGGGVEGAAGKVSDASGYAGKAADLAEKVGVLSKEKSEAINKVLSMIGHAADGLGSLAKADGAAGPRSESSVEQKMKDDKLLEGVNSLIDTGLDIGSELLPVVGALKNGKATLEALKDTVERVKLRGATGDLRDQAMLNAVSQLSKAFDQAAGRETRLGAEAGVKTVTKGIDTAASIAKDTGVGAKVGLGLKVTSKTVEYGGKVVFAAIDFSKAEDAVKTLKDAQAGDREAQKEVFAHHAHYAKMLIAVMAKAGNPLATKYLVDRGLTEAEIGDDKNSRDILFDYAVSQSKEEEEPKTFAQAVQEKLDLVAGGIDKIRALASSFGKRIGVMEGKPEAPLPEVMRTYSADDIRTLKATLAEAEKAQQEKGKDAPPWLAENVRNLKAGLEAAGNSIADQYVRAQTQAAEWEKAARGETRSTGAEVDPEKVEELAKQSRETAKELEQLYRACTG